MAEIARISRELFDAGLLFADPKAQTKKLNELVKLKSNPISEDDAREFMQRFTLNPEQQYRDLFQTEADAVAYVNAAGRILDGLVSMGILSNDRPPTATDRALYAQKLNWALFVLGIANSSEVSAGLYADHFVTKLMGHDVNQPFQEPVHQHISDFLKYRDFKKLAEIQTQRSPAGFSEDVLLALGLLGFMPVPKQGLIQSAAMNKQFFFKDGGIFSVDFEPKVNALVLRHDHQRNPRVVPDQLKAFHRSWTEKFADFVPREKLGQLPSVVINSPTSPFPREADRVHIGQIQPNSVQGSNRVAGVGPQFRFQQATGVFGSLAALRRIG